MINYLNPLSNSSCSDFFESEKTQVTVKKSINALCLSFAVLAIMTRNNVEYIYRNIGLVSKKKIIITGLTTSVYAISALVILNVLKSCQQ